MSSLRSNIRYAIIIILRKRIPSFNGDYILHDLCRSLVKDNSVDCIIETGTNLGGTTIAMSKFVHKVISIELQFKRYLTSKWYSFNKPNIRLYHGNSASVFPNILPNITKSQRILFYLDAHWYNYNPLLDELNIY